MPLELVETHMFDFELAIKTSKSDLEVVRKALNFIATRSAPKWGTIFPRNRANLFRFILERPDVCKSLRIHELRMFRWTPQQWKGLMDLRPRRANPLKEKVEQLEKENELHLQELAELKEENEKLSAVLKALANRKANTQIGSESTKTGVEESFTDRIWGLVSRCWKKKRE